MRVTANGCGVVLGVMKMFWNWSWWWFLFLHVLLMSYLRKYCLIWGHDLCQQIFLKISTLLASTLWSLITIWVNFYIWCDVRCSTFFFCMWICSFHSSICCKDFPSPFNCLGTRWKSIDNKINWGVLPS